MADVDLNIAPKAATGPKVVDGLPIEGTWRAHQVPLSELATKPEHLRMLEEWMRSYKPEELFDEQGKLREDLAALAPEGDLRMGANPNANGGLLLKELSLPDLRLCRTCRKARNKRSRSDARHGYVFAGCNREESRELQSDGSG